MRCVQGQPPPVPVASWKRWVVLVGLATTALMVVLDTMVMLIALPSLQSDLGISQDDGQWVITLYSLSYGGLLLLGGRVGDYNGRKRAFVIGLVGFVAASILGGAAQDGMTLFAARALQGVFAALLVPAGLAAISVLFTEPRERARALAVYSTVGGSGLAIGMVLGGVLTEYTSWRGYRAVTFGAAALMLIACIVGAILIGRAREARQPAPLPDVPFELPHVAAATPLVTSPWPATGPRTVHTEPEVTETVTTRIATRRTVDGEIVTVETTTVTRTVVETSVTEQVTSRKEPAPHKRMPVSK